MCVSHVSDWEKAIKFESFHEIFSCNIVLFDCVVVYSDYIPWQCSVMHLNDKFMSKEVEVSFSILFIKNSSVKRDSYSVVWVTLYKSKSSVI